MPEARQDGKEPLLVVRRDVAEVLDHFVIVVMYFALVRCAAFLYPLIHDGYQRSAAELHLLVLFYILFGKFRYIRTNRPRCFWLLAFRTSFFFQCFIASFGHGFFKIWVNKA